MFNKRVFIVLFLLIIATGLSAQESLIKPVFADSSSGLIFIEGEDAVSTNFANQAVSNFGCSGYRAVQLSRVGGLQGGAAFYAEFVFYVEEAGEYEFWYGGTPPGPADELSPSYSSPFRYSLDGAEMVNVYREDMIVFQGYTPSYYWNQCSPVSLTEGTHRLRIEVAEKRAFDGRYYFYLDNLFFLNRERISEIEAVKPAVFPSVREATEMDYPFLSINEYQNYINSHPDEIAAYIELSLVYSLLGDYVSSLKMLTKAMAIDASDVSPIILAAKNRLWKGDVRESLELYERALNLDSEDPVLWAEAGKVAAWTAEYDKSIDFFTRGLELFPDNLNMRVNLALTYLWMARDDEAQEAFNAAFGSAEDDPEKLTELAWIEEVNGYPQYAQEVYEKSIGLFPEYLEFYLLLQSSYLSSGDSDAADEVGRRIESTFISSAQLQNKLEIYKKKLSLRDEVLDSYLDRLKEDPGNLELRQELSQTYFWNGLSGEAIEQIKYVIITHSYRAAGTWMRRNSELLVLLDSTASAAPFYSAYQAAAADAAKMINTASADLVKAKKAAESEEDKTALRNAEQTLADSIAAASQLAGLGDEMTEALNGWDELVKTVLETEKSENEAFNQAVSASGWQWDKSWQINELEEIMQEERELASYMLSRIFFSDRNYRSAASVLTPEPQAGEVVVETTETAENAEAQTAEGATAAGTETELDYSSLTIDRLYALYQAMLLGGDETGRRALYDKERQRLEAEYPHLAVVEERLSLLDNLQFDNAAGVYFEGIEVEAADVIKTLTDHGKEVSDEQKRLALILSQLTAVAEKELERANYYLEADTYLIRYELGNYYLEDGLNNKASEQFRRVVNVDPWNISAAYKLGIVEQRYGNWSEAMKYYKKVYYQDPNYENTVYYFNQLARTHADTTSAKFQLIVSPAEIALTGELDWKTEFNSFIGMGIDYNLDQQRLYRDLDGEQKGSFQVHMLEASVPFTLSTIGLSLTPEIGFYAESIFYKTDLFFFNGDPAGDLPADVVTIPEFLETISVYPIFGASLNWIWNSLTVNASWRNVIEPDTFYEERDIIRKNDIELNINTWFDFENDLLGPLTTRTYSRLQFMDDEAGNVKWQVLQDAMLGFNILSNPITRLSPSVTVNYEDATEAVGQGYYSPQKVLELKGGLRSSFIFPSADWSRAFEAVIRGAGGGYWSRLGEPEQVLSVKAEAGIEANWIKNSNHYYLNLGWLQTFNEDDTEEYWEISLSLGTSLKLPGLLTK